MNRAYHKYEYNLGTICNGINNAHVREFGDQPSSVRARLQPCRKKGNE